MDKYEEFDSILNKIEYLYSILPPFIYVKNKDRVFNSINVIDILLKHLKETDIDIKYNEILKYDPSYSSLNTKILKSYNSNLYTFARVIRKNVKIIKTNFNLLCNWYYDSLDYFYILNYIRDTQDTEFTKIIENMILDDKTENSLFYYSYLQVNIIEIIAQLYVFMDSYIKYEQYMNNMNFIMCYVISLLTEVILNLFNSMKDFYYGFKNIKDGFDIENTYNSNIKEKLVDVKEILDNIEYDTFNILYDVYEKLNNDYKDIYSKVYLDVN